MQNAPHLKSQLISLPREWHIQSNSQTSRKTVTKKEQNTEKTNKKQNDKPKKQTLKAVPDKTLKSYQCRFAKMPAI